MSVPKEDSSASISFKIPKSEIDAFREAAASKGFQLWDNHGIVNFRGIVFKFRYEEPVLTIDIAGKPLWMSVSFIKRKLTETVGRDPI